MKDNNKRSTTNSIRGIYEKIQRIGALYNIKYYSKEVQCQEMCVYHSMQLCQRIKSWSALSIDKVRTYSTSALRLKSRIGLRKKEYSLISTELSHHNKQRKTLEDRTIERISAHVRH